MILRLLSRLSFLYIQGVHLLSITVGPLPTSLYSHTPPPTHTHTHTHFTQFFPFASCFQYSSNYSLYPTPSLFEIVLIFLFFRLSFSFFSLLHSWPSPSPVIFSSLPNRRRVSTLFSTQHNKLDYAQNYGEQNVSPLGLPSFMLRWARVHPVARFVYRRTNTHPRSAGSSKKKILKIKIKFYVGFLHTMNRLNCFKNWCCFITLLFLALPWCANLLIPESSCKVNTTCFKRVILRGWLWLEVSG